MPGVYVFPGGRVDAEDRLPSGFAENGPPLPPGLDRATRSRIDVFRRAAIRETYEETGLFYGAPGGAGDPRRSDPPSGVWADFARESLLPGFRRLWPVARAITPATSPIRFHTRFFLGDGRYTAGRLGGDGELEDLAWFPVARTAGLPFAEVTSLVLREAVRHYEGLKKAPAPGRDRPAALFRWIGPSQRPAFAPRDLMTAHGNP